MRSVRLDVLLVVPFVLAIGSRSYAKPQVSPPSARLVDTVWKIVDEKYVDSTYNGHSPPEIRKRFLDTTYSTAAEGRNAARAMLELLGDPLTRLIDPAEFASLAKEFKGETASIGLADPWTLRDETTRALKVLHVIAGSPAFRTRIEPDDLIEAIDDAPTKTMSRDEAFERMAGKPGTAVELSLLRGTKRLRVSVTREVLAVRTVSATIVTEGGTPFGYLVLSEFGKDSAEDMRNALEEMLKGNVQGIALDLRNNPGGFLPASREIAGFFLSEKQVLYHSIDRTGAATEIQSTGRRSFPSRLWSS